ncbi:MAG: hypothetical protein ISS89_03825 [Candidatus Omnitrophica bacterium]|nr:hypothetical protein [Candidatus Omnitrophota bacterium]
MEKLRYEFDPHNRLVTSKSGLRGIRKVLDGQFRISKGNSLSYHVKAPVPADIKAPHQVKLRGNWSLTKEHQLRLTLDKWKRQTFGDQVTIQGEILDVRKNSLLFAVTSRTKNNVTSRYILELSGSWQADERNRLTFRVNKGKESPDSLIFDGVWQIDKNYQITYRYQRKQLVRKNKEVHTLIFKGHWDIRDKARLSYALEGSSDSEFDFKTSAGIFRDNYIKYELGIGLSCRKEPTRRIITFFGKWKIKKGLGLVFEVEQEKRKIQALVFGAEARLTDKGTVSFKLRNSLDKGMGVKLELSRDIFKGDGQVFLRLLGSKKESTIQAGVGWRW